MRSSRKALLVAASVALMSSTHAFAAEFIQNGDFEQTTINGADASATPSEIGLNGYTVANWSSVPAEAGYTMPYSFIFNPTLGDPAAYSSQSEFGTLTLDTGNHHGLGSDPATLVSPSGGQFYATLGQVPPNSGAFEYHPGTLTQTVSGLVVGSTYTLTFLQAAALEPGNDNNYDGGSGTRYSGFNVTFGSDGPHQLDIDATPPQGFTPWHQESMAFTATAETQALSFTGIQFQGAYSLLDDVSLTGAAVPEPTTAALSLVAGVGLLRRSRRRTV